MSEIVSVQEPQSSISMVELVVISFFGLMTLCGLVLGVSLGFSTNDVTGAYELQFFPLFLGFSFASLSSLAMIWLRDRAKGASAWLAAGVLLWFIGINFMGFAGAMALDPPNNETFSEALGLISFCLSSGGFVALSGLGAYFFDRRRSKPKNQHAVSAAIQQVEETQAQASTIEVKLERAAEYRHHIDKLIKQRQQTVFADTLAPITDNLKQWEAQLRHLVQRIKDFENDKILQRDLQEIPVTIDKLQAQLETESNPEIKQDIEEALTGYQSHQRQLDALATIMRRTELDIDETLAAIGAIYSQLQLLGAKDIDSQRIRRLSASVDEQAQHLEDLLEAMDEVYSE